MSRGKYRKDTEYCGCVWIDHYRDWLPIRYCKEHIFKKHFGRVARKVSINKLKKEIRGENKTYESWQEFVEQGLD